MGFLRRFSEMPSIDVLSEIEGVVIIDGLIQGVPRGAESGVACCVGEFADVTYGVAIDANGVVTTSPRPIEIIGGDFEDKVGGFDETLGEHGGDQGNGYLECKNKKFSRLVCVPINFASSQGARLWRELPTNKSATDPSPVVEVQAATVPAGTEFRSGANRVRLAAKVTFFGNAEYTRAADGSVTSAGAAAFQNFVSASGNFQNIVRDDGKVGVKVGDLLVLGRVGGAGALGANASTYRVRSITNGTTLVVEKMDGSSFDWTTGAAQPWRLYTGLVGDSGLENHVGTQAGYKIPARPLDATIAINTTLTPTIAADPASPGADTWAPLSGLRMRSAPVTGIVYTATIQAPNAVNDAAIDALYALAIASVHEDVDPTSDVSIIWGARKSATIRDQLKAFVAKRKGQGRGCVATWSPALDVLSKDTVLGDAAPGVGSARTREGIMNWPGLATYVSAAVGKSIKRADGTTSTDGTVDTSSDGWAASVMSCLAPEKNPGEASATVQDLLAGWISLQSGVTGLDREFYKRAKAKGLMAPRISKGLNGQAVREFQSGVTTSLNNGEREVNVRRFSFYVQDTCAQIVDPFSKQLLTPKLEGDVVTGVSDFIGQLLADNRISGYEIDAVTGNTKALRAAGIFVVKVYVEMLSDARVLVIDARVGLGVLEVSAELRLAA